LAASLCSATLLTAVAPTPANATVTSATGDSWGYTVNISLFGGAQTPVNNQPEASTSGQPVNYAATGTVKYGPATIFNSGPIAVTAAGNTTLGSARSSSSLTNVGTWVGVAVEDTGWYLAQKDTYVPTLGGEMDPFIAASVHTECSVTDGSPAKASTTIVGGRTVSKDNSNAPYDMHYAPVSPTAVDKDDTTASTFVTGTLDHIGDSWKIRYNEQKASADGKTIEVWGAHLYLLGPTAVGDMWIGYSKCSIA